MSTLEAASALLDLIALEQLRAQARSAEALQYEHQLRSLVSGLASSPAPATGDVECLDGSAAVQAWLDDQLETVQSSVRSFIPGGAQSRASLDGSAPRNDAVLGRGVALRGIFLTSATHDPATRRYARLFTEAGAQYRTVTSLPLRMVLFDDQVAVLPLRLEDDRAGAVVVRDRTSLTALQALFELYWAKAVVFGQRGRAGAQDLTDVERTVLQRLARGERDEAVARALGISDRTLRRTVAGLMERLGAQSRFQAGVLARKAGWLD